MKQLHMNERLGSSLDRVRAALAKAGTECHILTLPDSTHSAADAAKAIGCEVGQIAKSIIFRASTSDAPVLIIASGTNRVDEKKVAALIGVAVGKADADFIRERTGFAIGGVAPVGHTGPVRVLIDEDLWQFEAVWAAAGTPNAVFKTTPVQLQAITSGLRCAIAK